MSTEFKSETDRDRAAQPPRVRIYALGGFRVVVDGRPIPTEAWRRRKARQLFKCLLSLPGHRIGRYELIELFWPESDSESGAINVRSILHATRRVLEVVPGAAAMPPMVISNRDSIWLRADAQVWVDADAFEQLATQALQAPEAGGLEAADQLYAGDYLPEDLYEDWAIQRRDDLKRTWTALQFQIAHAAQSHGRPDAAVRPLERLLVADPWNERAARELMVVLARTGRRTDAARVFSRLVQSLKADLEVAPSAATVQIYESTRTLDQAPLEVPSTDERVPIDVGPEPRNVVEVAVAAETRGHNLPAQPNALIGRVHEVAATRDLLMDPTVRQVTLVGPAGCGKTRVALEVASQVVNAFKGNVWFVDLSPIRDPDLVAFAIGGTLEVPQPLDGQSHLQRVANAIDSAPTLLVLDNFEQVVAAAADVGDLLADCPSLKVLVTSREPLHLRWEHQVQVSPLAAPDPSRLPSVASIAESPAVALFVERAQAVRPGLRLGDADMRTVAEICTRLDGLPLAIELAAARINLFGPQAMLARMDHRLELLTVGSRDVPERHQGLQVAFEWSHHLLGDAERAIFRRLAVFAGGWNFDAAAQVCGEPRASPVQAQQALERLVDKSMVRVRLQPDDEPRCEMLETLREFAFAKLEGSGELELVQRFHAEWCVASAEAAESALSGARQLELLDQLEREHDNYRAALSWSFRGGDAWLGARLAAALSRFWEVRGYVQEADRWLQRAVGVASDLPPAARAKVQGVAGHVAFLRGEHDRARLLQEESLALFRASNNCPGVARSLVNLGLTSMAQAADDKAAALLEEGLDAARRLGDKASIALSLDLLGRIAYHARHFTQARVYLDESLAVRRAEDDGWGVAQALSDLGDVLDALGITAAARAAHADSLDFWRAAGDPWGLAYGLEGIARLVLARTPAVAVRLIAAANAARERMGIRPLPARQVDIHRALDACRAARGEASFATDYAAGAALALKDAVELALREVRSAGKQSLR